MSSSSTGAQIGREQANLSREPRPAGRSRRPARSARRSNLINKRFELTYATDWQPIELKIDATVADPRTQGRAARARLATSFATTTAINEVTQNGVTDDARPIRSPRARS